MRRLLVIAALCLAASPALRADQSSDLLGLVNQFRSAHQVSALVPNPALTRAAGAYAVILATQAEFSHQIGGTTATGRVQAVGYPGGYIGENIARGFFDPATVEAAWEASPGHRINLLDPNFQDIGIGIASGPFGQSWVQDFGRIGAVTPTPPSPPQTVALLGKFQLYQVTSGQNVGAYILLPVN